MDVRPAEQDDLPAFLHLASQVEHWFGTMVSDAGFRESVQRHIGASTAIVAVANSEAIGGLLFGGAAPVFHTHWLVVSEHQRGLGVGRALMAYAQFRFVRGPATIEVITFGRDHPGALLSGARAFYERLGFVPGEMAPPGPEGGSRQVFRISVD